MASNLPRFARGQFQVDYESRIDFEQLRKDRVERTQQRMKAEGIDAVFLWKDENVRYLSGLRVIMLQYRSSAQYGVLLTQQGLPIVFVSSGELARAELSMPWVKTLYPVPILEEKKLVDHFVRTTVKPLFTELGIDKGKVALDAMNFLQHEAYQKHLASVDFVDGETFMPRVRRVKTGDELKLMHEACAIADAVTQTAIDAVRPGVRENDVAAEAMHTLFRLGGEFAHLASPFVASGERMAPPHRFPSDKIIREGDVVFIDIGASWNGYFGDCGRAVICGKPHPRQQEVYTAVYESLNAGIEMMRPGNTNNQAAEAFRSKAKEHGLEKNFIFLFIGHGLGVTPNEPPYIGELMEGSEEVVFEPGMVFAVEPLIWVPDVPGGAGVRLEDTVLITEDNPLRMTRTAFDDKLLL